MRAARGPWVCGVFLISGMSAQAWVRMCSLFSPPFNLFAKSRKGGRSSLPSAEVMREPLFR